MVYYGVVIECTSVYLMVKMQDGSRKRVGLAYINFEYNRGDKLIMYVGQFGLEYVEQYHSPRPVYVAVAPVSKKREIIEGCLVGCAIMLIAMNILIFGKSYYAKQNPIEVTITADGQIKR